MINVRTSRFAIILLLVFVSMAACASERNVDLRIVYKVSVSKLISKLEFKIVIPNTVRNRQTVNNVSFSIQPDTVYTNNSVTYALFKFYDLTKSFKIVFKSNMTIFNQVNQKNDSIENDLTKYLAAEEFIESESPKIVAVAATLRQKTDIETVMKTFDYVKKTISYELNPAIGAEKVLETHIGKCMDYSDLFVALLRANKIPAKSMFGAVVDYSGDDPLHAWPEAYLKKQGWVRFDPTGNQSEIVQVDKNYVMKIANKYIILSQARNDSELHKGFQYYYHYYCPDLKGDEIKIKVSYEIY